MVAMVSIIPAKAYYTDVNGTYTWPISSPGSGLVGVKKTFSVTKTYGYSWIDITEDTRIYTQLTIGSTAYAKTYGNGYAQSSQQSQPGSVRVSEAHGK